VTTSPDGHSIVYTNGVSNTNIWRLDLSSSPPKASKAIASSREQRAPSVSPDGTRLALDSNRTGPSEIWVAKTDGTESLQLSSFGILLTGTPRWSPDGKLIVFDSRVAGGSNLYIVEAAGGTPRKLQTDVPGGSLASWSADGQWIYFEVDTPDFAGVGIWKVPARGGHAVQLIGKPALFPMESPDGKYLYFQRNTTLWRATTDGSQPEPVPGMPQVSFLPDEWLPTASGIYFLAHPNGKNEIDLFDFRTNSVRRIFEMEGALPAWIGSMTVSSDGRTLYYPQTDLRTSDLMMIEQWKAW
jgi:Tol biopolymer transport system component